MVKGVINERRKLKLLNKNEYEQVVNELKAQCVSAEKIGFAVLKDGSTLPCVKIDGGLFKKLVEAGSINNTSRITTFSLPSYFFVKLEINWPAIKQKLTIFFSGYRDRPCLEHLCDAKKIALTADDSSVVVVDGIRAEKLEAELVITSMMYHPKGV